METQEVAIEVSAGPTFRAATPPPEVKEEESSGTYRPNATGAGAALFPEVAQSVVVGASLLELCNQKGALMNKRHTVLTPSGDAMREWLLKATEPLQGGGDGLSSVFGSTATAKKKNPALLAAAASSPKAGSGSGTANSPGMAVPTAKPQICF